MSVGMHAEHSYTVGWGAPETQPGPKPGARPADRQHGEDVPRQPPE